MANDGESKWECPQCTYLNYLSASICTMCRTLRRSVFITEPPCTSTAACASEDPPSNRWPCPDCTYMNVLQAQRCIFCSHARPSSYDDKVKEEIAAKDELAVDVEQVNRLSKALLKWDCLQCTYKNWPAVKHCTMCGSPKDLPPLCNNEGWSSSSSKKTNEVERHGSSASTGPGSKDLDRGSLHSEKTGNNKILNADNNVDAKLKGDGEWKSGLGAPDTKNTLVVTNDEKRPILEKYLHLLRRTVDTGCASFLEAVAELINPECESDEKLLEYIYHYGEGNRKVTIFESVLFDEFEQGERSFYNLTLLDFLRLRRRPKLVDIPRFFIESATFTVVLPGLSGEDRAEQIHKNLRDFTRVDYDMSRIANNNSMFALPNAFYDIRSWIASGENNLRVIMDFDDRQVMSTVCCLDAFSLSAPVGRNLYAPLALRNRGGGHSLVDAVSQGLWGVVDKDNLLRESIFHALCMKETLFRSRWATSLSGLNFDIWTMQRYWTSIMECHEPGSPLEQIHILVLAQILNRPIIVFPIESSKLNVFPARDGHRSGVKHPVEGFYPQLPGMNNYRLCAPLLLGYTNGNFHALILPPPLRSPVLNRIDMSRWTRVFRYIRCPPIPLTHYVQFATSDKEAEEFVRDGLVIDVDSSGQQWLYHSAFTFPLPKPELGTLLWKDWLIYHFPRSVRDNCEEHEDGSPVPDITSTVIRDFGGTA